MPLTYHYYNRASEKPSFSHAVVQEHLGRKYSRNWKAFVHDIGCSRADFHLAHNPEKVWLCSFCSRTNQTSCCLQISDGTCYAPSHLFGNTVPSQSRHAVPAVLEGSHYLPIQSGLLWKAHKTGHLQLLCLWPGLSVSGLLSNFFIVISHRACITNGKYISSPRSVSLNFRTNQAFSIGSIECKDGADSRGGREIRGHCEMKRNPRK